MRPFFTPIPGFATFRPLAGMLLRPAPMKQLSSALFAACLILGPAVYAQDQGQTPPSQRKQAPDDAQKTTITGCLTKGSGDGVYIVADQTSGEKVQFNGPAQIDRYVNQTVKLTGTMSGGGADKTFSPETIAQVSPSCSKAQ